MKLHQNFACSNENEVFLWCRATNTDEKSNSAICSHTLPGWLGVWKDSVLLFCLEEGPLVREQCQAHALTPLGQKMRTGTWPAHCSLERGLREKGKILLATWKILLITKPAVFQCLQNLKELLS